MRNLVLMFVLFAIAHEGPAQILVDGQATQETRSLFRNLRKVSKKHILIGHQHATEYGHGWSGEPDRSDIKSVCGSHPAVIGIDFSGLSGRSQSDINNEIDRLRSVIMNRYRSGGVVTASWHFHNPVSEGGFYWNDSLSLPAVAYIRPGGDAHEKYKSILRNLAEVAHRSVGPDGELIPIIFRPYHEFDGSWFWWGADHCTPEEFVDLWRFTVSYLRDSLEVHNFLYGWSPDCKFSNEQEFIARYPGNEWVDMVGMDNYRDFGRDGFYDLETGHKLLKIVSDFGKKNKKLAAFTETGLESIVNPNWWTESLLSTLWRKNLRLSYVLVWRNDQWSPTHYYAPFPGHPSAENFLEFYDHPYTLFENDLKPMYQ